MESSGYDKKTGQWAGPAAEEVSYWKNLALTWRARALKAEATELREEPIKVFTAGANVRRNG